MAGGSAIPNDPELPLPLDKVHPIHEVVHVDYFLPGCPPSADAFWAFLDRPAGGARRTGSLPKTPGLHHDYGYAVRCDTDTDD